MRVIYFIIISEGKISMFSCKKCVKSGCLFKSSLFCFGLVMTGAARTWAGIVADLIAFLSAILFLGVVVHCLPANLGTERAVELELFGVRLQRLRHLLPVLAGLVELVHLIVNLLQEFFIA